MFKFSLFLIFATLLAPLSIVNAGIPILKTGQTVSYNEDGSAGTLKDDGYYQAGSKRNYTRNGDIVIDHTSSLMWQDDTSSGVSQSWVNATDRCGYFNLGGYEDWRLPTIMELETMLDLGNSDLLSDIFQNGHIYQYWSSQVSIGYAWYIRIISGQYGTYNQLASDYVGTRCVRNF